MPSHLALDIETVPAKNLTDYNKTIQDKILEKINKRKDKNPEFDYNYFASIHGDFGKIICISLGYVTDDNAIQLTSIAGDDEKKILKEFNHLIKDHQGIFIHYNGLNFDIPFILQRMTYHNLICAGKTFTNLRRFSNDPHFDLMMIYYNWDIQRVLPLGILAELHGLPSPKNMLSGEKVFEAYQNKEWQNIIRYCEFDTATTLNLWWKIFQHKPVIKFINYRFSESPTKQNNQFSLSF